MSYRYRAVEPFWTQFYRLSAGQKEAARNAWKIFKTNPFDLGLGLTKSNACLPFIRKRFTR
jgi:hypothetical protein